MVRLLLALLLGLAPLNLFAQQSYDELFHMRFDGFGSSTLETSNLQQEQQRISAGLNYGFTLNEREDQLNLGASYSFFQMQHSGTPHQELNIHSTSLGVEYLKRWKNPYWAITISAGLAAVSDYQTDAATGYQTALSAIMSYGKSDDLIWSFGLFYSDQPFGSWLFPLVGVDWRLSERLYFSTMLFDLTYLEYAVKPEKLYMGIDLRADGQSFVVSDFQGFQDSYITSFSDAFPYYPFSNTVFADLYFNNTWVVFAKAGVLSGRSFLHETAEGLPIEESAYYDNLTATFTVQGGIAYRIRNF